MAISFAQRAIVPDRYTLEDILTVAQQHPFYNSEIEYPLTREEIAVLLQDVHHRKGQFTELQKLPILSKSTLQQVITRLCKSEHPRNTFKHSAYFSLTGGGSGVGIAMPFVTDAQENRAQRRTAGELMNRLGMVKPGDVTISVHTCGHLYRSLDLMCELVEYAGGAPLAAGNIMTPDRVVLAVKQFRPNVLFGEPGQLLQFARHVHSEYNNAEQPEDQRICFDRIVYTSEMLTPAQETFLSKVFGKHDKQLAFGSIYGGAEAGIWAMSNSAILPRSFPGSRDFIYDVRNMLVEVFKNEATHASTTVSPYNEEAEPGRLVLTSLQKLRQPLVRYDSGDLGSMHHLPQSVRETLGADADYLRIIRLRGRDLKESFDWQGGYFSMDQTVKALEDPMLGILKWQIILKDHEEGIGTHALEVRVMLGDNTTIHHGDDHQSNLRDQLKIVFEVDADLEYLFSVNVVNDLDDFQRSETGRKVIKLVDRRSMGTSGVQSQLRQPVLYDEDGNK